MIISAFYLLFKPGLVLNNVIMLVSSGSTSGGVQSAARGPFVALGLILYGPQLPFQNDPDLTHPAQVVDVETLYLESVQNYYFLTMQNI